MTTVIFVILKFCARLVHFNLNIVGFVIVFWRSSSHSFYLTLR